MDPDQGTTTSTADTRPARHHWLESVALFALGTGMMLFVYGGIGGAGDTLGVPGRDSFYHVKMAAMIPDVGLVDRFDWLQQVYFTQDDDRFVSHHYGFHVLLVPFVKAAHALTGEYLPGGRWMIALCFGLNLVLFDLLLASQRVRWRWLWLILWLFLPYQFYTRQAYIRAIGPSLAVMQALLLAMFTGRHLLAGLAVMAYVHLYLGGVMFAPAIVASFAVASCLGRKGERHFPVRLVGITACAWLIGVLTCPYRHGMVDFLQLQVFGSGLSPDIPVGREWKPYSSAWFFVQMSWQLLLVWCLAICVRCRRGPTFDAATTTTLLLHLLFLMLTFKARRFIEYWPPVALLSAALIARPVLDDWATAWRAWITKGEAQAACRADIAATVFACIAITAMALLGPILVGNAGAFAAEWRIWIACGAIYLMAMLARRPTGHTPGGPRRLPAAGGLFLMAALFVLASAAAAVIALRACENVSPNWPLGPWEWSVIVGALGVAAWLLAGRAHTGPSIRTRLGDLRMVVTGVAVVVALLIPGSAFWSAIRNASRCTLDLEAAEDVMHAVMHDAEPGDIIFTDDWDIFPLFFYYNTHNHFLVGLDPKFTQARRPDLWQRYVKITRGQTPAKTTYTATSEDGTETTHDIQVELTDITTHFHAKYVVIDRDHGTFAAKLAKMPELAELFYPSTVFADARRAPYLAFRIRSPETTP